MKPHKLATIETLLARGVSQHEIARKTGIDRKTVRKYQQASLSDSKSPMATGSQPGASENPPPRPPAATSRAPHSACEPYRAWITAQVELGRNAMAIYQELVDRFGFEARYNSVKRFCRALKHRELAQFDRLEFAPGEEAQVDYGEGAPTRHPQGGRYRKPRLFVMTLRYSRRSFRKVVWKSSSAVWAQLHEQAFRYFGGAVSYVVLDNLREGVIKPDLYEPELNRLYAELLAHYGVVADPARVRDPNRKGTVESAIQHTQSTALKGRRFESIDEQNAFLEHWETRWAATRIHGRAKRQVEEMFQAERPHLKALPPQAFRYFEEGLRTVQDDTTVQIDRAWYAARPAPIGSRVLVRVFEHDVEIRDLHTLELIRRHARATRPGELKLPDDERPFNPSRQTQRIFEQAREIGPQTLALCERIFSPRGREAQRTLWGIVNLARRYPGSLVEDAAAIALAGGVTSARSVRKIIERRLHELADSAHEPEAAPLTQQHDLIRDPGEYAQFFNQHVRRAPAASTTEGDAP